jgi:hypothetical protein
MNLSTAYVLDVTHRLHFTKVKHAMKCIADPADRDSLLIDYIQAVGPMGDSDVTYNQ